MRHGASTGRLTAGSNYRPRSCKSGWGIPSITVTLDTYGHLFPRGDDGAEMAAAEKSLVG